MSTILAIDVAVLLPPDIESLAKALNARLSPEPDALHLDDSHIPHLSLTQHFVRDTNLAGVLTEVERVIRGVPPLGLHAVGLKQAGSLQIEVARSGPLQSLHERLMDALESMEQRIGTTDAFLTDGEPGRAADVLWVTTFRLRSAYARYAPHITLGHGDLSDVVEPFEFEGSRVAACRLGRYCTCRTVIREWTLAC